VVHLEREVPPVVGRAAERSGAPSGASEAARLALAAASLKRAGEERAAAAPGTPHMHAAGGKRSVKVEELPPALRTVVLQVAQGREMIGLEIQRKERDGHPVDEVEFEIDGVEHELTMRTDGKVVASEFDVEVADLPATVMNAIQAALPGARVSEVERHQSGDEFFFEVQLTHQGREHELDITDTGRILKDKLRPLR
jgi:hypothetical protein